MRMQGGGQLQGSLDWGCVEFFLSFFHLPLTSSLTSFVVSSRLFRQPERVPPKNGDKIRPSLRRDLQSRRRHEEEGDPHRPILRRVQELRGLRRAEAVGQRRDGVTQATEGEGEMRGATARSEATAQSEAPASPYINSSNVPPPPLRSSLGFLVPTKDSFRIIKKAF